MKFFSRLVGILATVINLGILIFNLVNGNLILAAVSFAVIVLITVFGVKIGLWSKEPWVT